MSAIELTVLRAALPRIRQLREAKLNSMMAGQPQDFSQYRYLVGGLDTLTDVETVLQETLDDIQKG